MNVSLTPQLEQWVSKRVESGMYNSASEVVREALRLLVEEDEVRNLRIAELKKQVGLGVDQLERGLVRPFNVDVVEHIKQRGRQTKGSEG